MWLKQRLLVFLLVLFFVPCFGYGEVVLSDEEMAELQQVIAQTQEDLEQAQLETQETFNVYLQTVELWKQAYNEMLTWRNEANQLQIDYEKLQQSISEQLSDYQTCKVDLQTAKNALTECQKSYKSEKIKNGFLTTAVIIGTVCLVADTALLIKYNRNNLDH